MPTATYSWDTKHAMDKISKTAICFAGGVVGEQVVQRWAAGEGWGGKQPHRRTEKERA